MTKNQAVKRISWRFSKFKTFNVNADDINAWNEVLDYMNGQDKTNFDNNILFAKLYISFLKISLEHYNATLFDDEPQKAMHKFLEKPIGWHYQQFVDFLNMSELYEAVEDGKVVQPNWNIEDVEPSLNQMVTECLRKYSQY